MKKQTDMDRLVCNTSHTNHSAKRMSQHALQEGLGVSHQLWLHAWGSDAVV